MNEKRIIFLDYLRATACLMVIFVHSCEFFYVSADGIYIANEENRLWVTIVDSALRSCVPLFAMASAYLLLPLKDNTLNFFKRRFQRVLVPFIIWSFLYTVLPMVWGEFSWEQSKEYMLVWLTNFSPNAGHLWFVYMLVGVYLFMPILSPWLRQIGKREELIFLGIWFLSTFWHYIKMSVSGNGIYGECSWNEFHVLYYNSGYIGYLILAHYIRVHINWNLRKTLSIAIPVFLVGYSWTACQFYIHSTLSADAYWVEIPWRFCTPNVALMTFALFVVFKKINSTGGLFYRIVTSVSRLSYGMYLIHIFVLNIVYSYVSPYFNTPATIFIVGITTYIICYLLTKALSVLPQNKYLIG